jgi:hypothetical protein
LVDKIIIKESLEGQSKEKWPEDHKITVECSKLHLIYDEEKIEFRFTPTSICIHESCSNVVNFS